MIRVFGVLTKRGGSCDARHKVFARLSRAASAPSRDLKVGQLPEASVGIAVYKSINIEDHFYCCADGGLILAGHTAERKPLNARALFLRYRKYGPGFMDGIRGIFSVVFWDQQLGTAGIINDRLGLFPLYCYEDDTAFIFSTAAESLFSEPAVVKELDAVAVAEFFQLGFLPDGKTFVRQVRDLPPGTLVRFCRGQVHLGTYSEKSIYQRPSRDIKDPCSRLRKSIQDAVARRKGKGLFTAIHLTGGRDTRLIAACLHALGQPVRALTMFDRSTPAKEVLLAGAVARKFGMSYTLIRLQKTDHHYDPKILTADIKESLNGVLAVYPSSSKQVLEETLTGNAVLSGLMGGEVLGKDVNVYFPGGVAQPAGTIFAPAMIRALKRQPTLALEQIKLNAGEICPLHEKLYIFVHHICRSFLNTVEGDGWERPTSKFVGNVKYPFLDEELLALVFSLPSDAVGWDAYEQLYREHFAEFQKIPFLREKPEDRIMMKGCLPPEIRARIKRMLRDNKDEAARFFNDPEEISREYPREFLYFLSWYREYKECLSCDEGVS